MTALISPLVIYSFKKEAAHMKPGTDRLRKKYMKRVRQDAPSTLSKPISLAISILISRTVSATVSSFHSESSSRTAP